MPRVFPLVTLLSLLGTTPALAIESETTPVLALRLSKALQSGDSLDVTFNARSIEGFHDHEREIFEIRYSKRMGSNEFMGACNIQFDRNGSPGSEHRLWQQNQLQLMYVKVL